MSDFKEYLIKNSKRPSGIHHKVYRFDNGFGASVITAPEWDFLYEVALIEFDGEEWDLVEVTNSDLDRQGVLLELEKIKAMEAGDDI